MPSGQLVDRVNVNKTEENGTTVYHVEFIPQACSYNFALLAVVPGQVGKHSLIFVVVDFICRPKFMRSSTISMQYEFCELPFACYLKFQI